VKEHRNKSAEYKFPRRVTS